MAASSRCRSSSRACSGPTEFWVRWVAFGIFIAAAVTDYFDGYLARAWEQQSSLGRMLDPIADKLLVAACLLMLAADGTIPAGRIWAAIVILCREILVSGLREYPGRAAGQRAGDALAKWKTTLQLVALGFCSPGRRARLSCPGTDDDRPRAALGRRRC